MNSKEHKEYIKALRAYSQKILESEENTKRFLVEAGIHTKTGRLTKAYSYTETIVGYTQSKKLAK